MHILSSASILLASLLPAAVLAHNIQLPSHGRECFHEELHKDDKMTVTFQVGDREFGSAGNLDIDFWVRRSLSFSLSRPSPFSPFPMVISDVGGAMWENPYHANPSLT